jgi:hypothetical protein
MADSIKNPFVLVFTQQSCALMEFLLVFGTARANAFSALGRILFLGAPVVASPGSCMDHHVRQC